MKILFLIRSLDAGGAERQLIELVGHLDKSRFQSTVVTFYNGGLLLKKLEKNPDVSLISLGKGGRWELIRFFNRLMSIIRIEQPDVIHGYLDVANLFSLLAGKLSGIKVVWGMRASNLDLRQYDWTYRFLYRLSAMLSFLPDAIICNSRAGKAYHLSQGYHPKRMEVVSNGIDTQWFHPDPESGQKKRREWGVTDDQILIGQVGRLDPMKNIEDFLNTSALLSHKNSKLRFVHVGDGPASYRQDLIKLCAELGLDGRFTWAGVQSDMIAVYSAFDVLVLSSSTEGFPNVVGEAMACGTPCVVTDVGDAAWIVGDTGVVVPPKNEQKLFDGLEQLMGLTIEARRGLGMRARQRIETLFSVQTLAERSGQIFLDVLMGERKKNI